MYSTLEERSRFNTSIDVFVLPSLTEGTPNVIIEAMAHGKPIIANAVGGVPDLVTEEVGILVPLDDVKALAAAMARLAGDDDLRHRMGDRTNRSLEPCICESRSKVVVTSYAIPISAQDVATTNYYSVRFRTRFKQIVDRIRFKSSSERCLTWNGRIVSYRYTRTMLTDESGKDEWVEEVSEILDIERSEMANQLTL
ncbi:MAG TPA: glycosyltransferase family 4 protein [Pyrinomonadaceae bacterium]